MPSVRLCLEIQTTDGDILARSVEMMGRIASGLALEGIPAVMSLDIITEEVEADQELEA